MTESLNNPQRDPELRRSHRRRRFRRHGRRAYIRSVYTLPSLATLGNAICGFGAMYVAAFAGNIGDDPLVLRLAPHRFVAACYLIFLAMVFDALDGRLARFTRHTTDFGGQLDSLADVVSFGAAPAFIALLAFKTNAESWNLPVVLSRLIWAMGAVYFACAALRLARFNVSNEHGEQSHFSFLGLPSPGAAGAVVSLVLMEQDLSRLAAGGNLIIIILNNAALFMLPVVILGTGLLMISNVRYPHLVNRYLRGKISIPQLLVAVFLLLMLIVAHRYTFAVAMLAYALWGPLGWAYARYRPKPSDDSGPSAVQVHA